MAEGVVDTIISGLRAIVESELFTRSIIVIAVIIAGIIVAVVIRRAIIRLTITILPRRIALTIARATFYTILGVTILIALGTIGVSLTGIAIAGGFAGIVLGLALQPLLSNLFAGLYMFSEKSFVQGDFVEVGGMVGRVHEIAIMSTKIRGLDGAMYRIPNKVMMDSTIANYSRLPIRRLDFQVSIAYREDADKAISAIKSMLENHPLVLEDPPPEVYVSKLGDSGVDIMVRVWIPTDLWYDVTMDLLWKVKKTISEAGIEIPFNQVDIWLRTPLEVKIKNTGNKDNV
ncbi:MAG: mechanosensitive ion channel family protein [Desulfurococcales archaeon]|nr:mechanosensitive ion channel family protein [Desulfurococcales archaeon]